MLNWTFQTGLHFDEKILRNVEKPFLRMISHKENLAVLFYCFAVSPCYVLSILNEKFPKQNEKKYNYDLL